MDKVLDYVASMSPQDLLSAILIILQIQLMIMGSAAWCAKNSPVPLDTKSDKPTPTERIRYSIVYHLWYWAINALGQNQKFAENALLPQNTDRLNSFVSNVLKVAGIAASVEHSLHRSHTHTTEDLTPSDHHEDPVETHLSGTDTTHPPTNT